MPVPTAFACTHIAYPHDQPGLWLDRCTASTAMGALAWMRLRVRVTATELGGQAVHTAAAWLDDVHSQRAALEHLVTGRRMSCTLADDPDTTWPWSRSTSRGRIRVPRRMPFGP